MVYFFVILFFSGLRDRVGPDWFSYVRIFEWDNKHQVFATAEPLFTALNILSGSLGFGIYGVNFVCSFLFLFGIFSFAKTTARPWLAIAVVMPYLVFVIGMSGIRQAAALGVCYIAVAQWYRFSLRVKMVLIGIASGFHNSALIFLVFLLFESRKWIWLKVLSGASLVIVLLAAAGETETFTRYSNVYVASNLLSPGAVQHILLSTIPAALYLLYSRRIRAVSGENRLVTLASWGCIIALPMTIVSSTGTDRLSLYLSFVQMWTYPVLLEVFKRDKAILLTGISLGIILVFLIYFNFSNTVENYVPYRNILFD
jgi:hypothetical protein